MTLTNNQHTNQLNLTKLNLLQFGLCSGKTDRIFTKLFMRDVSG